MPVTLRRLGLRLLVPLAFLAAWELLAVGLDRPGTLPRVEAVAAVLAHPGRKLLITGSLIENTLVSLVRVSLGFALAAALAVPLGMAMGCTPAAERLLDSTVEMLRPIPPLAWVPLILAWLGVKGPADWLPGLVASRILAGIQFSTVVVILIGAFFPILLSTVRGVKTVPPEYLESARTLGARRAALLFRVVVPASLPAVVAGLRIGLGIGWMCLVAAEMMPGSNAGLGYLIWYAYELLRTDVIVASMAVIGLIGFLMDRGFRRLERRIAYGAAAQGSW
ncbi:MAG: ABC transporter permease [Deferrisomatales bacterium]